jgi:gliding motility-associated-like protein
MPLVIINKRFLTVLLIIVLGTAYYKGYAQLCKGSLGDPVVKIDFGAGAATHAGALASGTTSYTYTSADFPPDGSYTVENTTAGAGNVWWSTTDHTGNTGGYMMVVNAAIAKTDYFYKSTVTGLCPGTTFEFAAWVVNLLRSRDISPPDITFTILTTTGTVLATYDTGIIPLTPSGPVWKQYGTYFTTPIGVTDVVIQMTNNSNGGAPANDLALDDITFRPCGPTMSSSFVTTSSQTASSCAGSSQSIALTSVVSTGYTNPVYQWQVNSGTAWADIAGATTPNYTIGSPTVAGTYLYRLVSTEAANAGSVACQVASNQLTLTVTPAVAAGFTYTGTSCLGSATVFADQSIASGVTISSWNWDFGDGQSSTAQNPVHTYTKAGTYTVTLNTTGTTGCPSSAQQTLHISAPPAAAFSMSTPDCATGSITFTDSSAPGEGTLTTWSWDFGDGSTMVNTSNAAFTHAFATAGTYTVMLAVTSSTGCANTLSQAVIIHPQPVADFVLPDICTSQSLAQFTDKSTIADNSTLSYLWDFGDPNAKATNPNTSTLQNPTHNYSAAANYTVKLTVTSINGCVNTKTAIFTVNGDNPTAAFTLDPANSYCSSDDVVLINQASVSFGKVTQIKMYWDYTGDQTNYTVYTGTQTAAGYKFTHNYGLFNTPGQTKTYTLLMLAYSGSSAVCAGQSPTQQITIKTNPTVTLSGIGTICQEALPVQITENKNGFTGTGVFSGTGVSSTGLFDPSQSGAGTFTISYVFTANNSCTYTSSQTVTVYATPTSNSGPSFTLLQGGSKKIYASATGDAPLTYKWTLADGSKATGLDHDDILQPITSTTDDATYLLTVTSVNGCTASSTMSVNVLKAPVVPNTFTPNNDGVNDTWNIKYLDSYPTCTVDIFNRYGIKVFASIGYGTAWDGTYNGANLPAGTYYYIINPKNGRSVIAGSITIIR